MSASMQQLQFYLRQRGLLFWSFFVPVFFFGFLATAMHFSHRDSAVMGLFILAGIAAGVGVFTASAQREILSKAQYFMMPSVRRGMLGSLVIVAVVVAALGVSAAILVPVLRAVTQGSPRLIGGLVAMMLVSYCLTYLLVFRFVYAAWAPFQFMWIFALGIKPMLRVTPSQLEAFLAPVTLWVGGAGLAAFFVSQMLTNRGVQRRLATEPFISIAEIKNAKRVEAFRRERGRHKGSRPGGRRCLEGVFQAVLRRVNTARQAGHETIALVWEAVYLGATGTVPRAPWVVWLLGAALVLALVLLGYYDGKISLRTDTEFNGWFSGLIFMGPVSVMGLMAYSLRTRVLGRLVGRTDILRAGWLGAAAMLTGSLVAVAAMLGLGHALSAVLPPVTVSDCTYAMVPPRTYLLGMPLFVLPIQLLVFTLWRRPRSPMVLNQTATLTFFIYHGALNMGGWEALVVVGPLAAVAWLALAWAWRWRVLRTDLG